MGNLRTAMTYVIIAFMCVGCAETQAQRMSQTTMTGLAHTLNATDAIVEPLFAKAALSARNQVIKERESDRLITVDEGMDRYRELMDDWYQLMEGLTLSRRILIIGQSALDIWLSSGDLPDEWVEFCHGVGEAFLNLVVLLEEVDVEVPEVLETLSPRVDTMCRMASAFIVVRGE